MIAASCLRVDGEGRLVVPVKRADGALVGVQTITADGTKRFTPGRWRPVAWSPPGSTAAPTGINGGCNLARSR